MSKPEQNEDRMWYDRGYRLGASEEQRDSRIPTIIGTWLLLGIAYADMWVAVTAVVIYSAFELLEWRDRKEEATEYRERYDPGDQWEW